MPNCQIRVRSDLSFNDIEYVKGWLASSILGFAFQHAKPENNHYHIYLFGIDVKPDSIRKTLGKYLPKQNYSVKTMAGPKNDIPLDPRVAWQYASAPESNPTLVWSQGLTDSDKDRYQLSAEVFYSKQKQSRQEISGKVTEMIVIKEDIVKQDKTWQRLMTELIESPGLYNGMTIPRIKAKIAVSYLNQLKAVPRPSDLHRYAVSLYYIAKHNLHQDENARIKDVELLEEYDN